MNRNKCYSISDKDQSKEFYDVVEATEVKSYNRPGANQEQNSEPRFTIIFDYKDGLKDVIYSTETGDFVFRRLEGTGWVGGKNEKVEELVNRIRNL